MTGCPWCGAGQYVAGNGHYRCGACRRHGVLPTPVNEGGDFIDAKDRFVKTSAQDLGERVEAVLDKYPHAVWLRNDKTAEYQKERAKIRRTMLRARFRKIYGRSLLITCGISAWFFLWLWLLGMPGYAVAVPTTALFFALEEMTW